jgi:hypothetical protein
MTAALPAWLRGPRGLLLAWLAVAGLLLAITLPALPTMTAQDPDDYMRLLEVRDWVGGQSWWDVRQYRMNPPLGADMHWSRLVDLPLGAALWFFRLFLAEPAASTAAMALIPLVELLAAMALIRRLLLALGEGEVVALGGAALVPLFPELVSNFLPLRIDHHGWQGVMALACMLASLRRDTRGAAITGALAAVWMTISLEGLMLVAALSALMAWRYVARGQRSLGPFLGAAAAVMAVLFLLTRPLWQWGHPVTDAVSWPHMLAFALSAGLMAVLTRRPQGTMAGRVLALVPVAAVGAGVIFAGLGRAAADPFSAMDPVVHQWWFDFIPEGLPITAQDTPTILMLVWTLGLAGAGWLFVAATRPAAAARWGELGAMALIAALLSLVVMRTSVSAQLLCVPFSAVMIARALPALRASPVMLVRVLGTLLCLSALTPSLATAAGKGLARAFPATMPGGVIAAGSGQRLAPAASSALCDLASLNRLPRAHIFATLDLGPEILVRTPDTVVISGYHRNSAKMREVIDAFSGDPRGAQAIVRANRGAYVALCASDPESHVYALRRGDGLAAAILAGRAPAWLAPVPGFDGDLKVLKVRD